MAALQSGHRDRLQNRRSRVRIPSGVSKIFRSLHIAVLLSRLNIYIDMSVDPGGVAKWYLRPTADQKFKGSNPARV
jgi:hypothetical protein